MPELVRERSSGNQAAHTGKQNITIFSHQIHQRNLVILFWLHVS
ncbi:hypothetical protein [[Phormidium] sp. ETS-05]|nr:hypothetical protein [[Phormidium] sp. ETS-05]